MKLLHDWYHWAWHCTNYVNEWTKAKSKLDRILLADITRKHKGSSVEGKIEETNLVTCQNDGRSSGETGRKWNSLRTVWLQRLNQRWKRPDRCFNEGRFSRRVYFLFQYRKCVLLFVRYKFAPHPPNFPLRHGGRTKTQLLHASLPSLHPSISAPTPKPLHIWWRERKKVCTLMDSAPLSLPSQILLMKKMRLVSLSRYFRPSALRIIRHFSSSFFFVHPCVAFCYFYLCAHICIQLHVVRTWRWQYNTR